MNPREQYGMDEARQCLGDLERYLAVMARRIASREPNRGTSEVLLATRFVGRRYSLSLVCRQGRWRRFLAVIDEPFDEVFVLGRLLRNGTAHVFEQGVSLFLNHLVHQGLFQNFRSDLAEALALCSTRGRTETVPAPEVWPVP